MRGTTLTVTFPAGTYVGLGEATAQDMYGWGCRAVQFASTARSSEIHAAWWGPPLDATRDDSLAIQAACDAVPPFSSATIILPPTPLGVQAPHLEHSIRLRRGHIVRGAAGTQGDNGTVLYCAELVTGIVVESIATGDDGGGGDRAVLRDFAIEGTLAPEWTNWADTADPIPSGARIYTPSVDEAGISSPNAEPRYYLRAVVGGAKGAGDFQNPGPIANEGIGYDVNDGAAVWRACAHSGIYVKITCYIENVRIHQFTNAGITYQTDHNYRYPGGPGNGNGGGASKCFIDSCGVGILSLGADANNVVFDQCTCTNAGFRLYGSYNGIDANPAHLHLFGSVGFWDEGPIGSRWLSCTIDTTLFGRGIYVHQYAGSSVVFVGPHEEGSTDLDSVPIPNHFGAGTLVGGYVQANFTPTSSGLVLLQSKIKNFYTQFTPTVFEGVTTMLQLPGFFDATSPNLGVLAGISDDTHADWNIHYGAYALPGYWGIRHGSEAPFLAWTTKAGTFDGTHLVGPSLLWKPLGSFHGNNGGYPAWYEFVDEEADNAPPPTYVRGGQRVPGDRYRTTQTVASYGSVTERVVLHRNDEAGQFEAGGAYPGLVTLSDAQADPADPVNAISWRSSQAGYLPRVFRAVALRGTKTTSGVEPDVSGYAVDDTFWDGDVEWKYLGDMPILGTTVLGATLQGYAAASAVNLTDDLGRELVLPDDSSFALHVTVLARKDDGSTARDAFEVVASTAGGALTIAADNVATTGTLVGAGWSAAFDAGAGLNMRLTCDSGADNVAFKARVEVVALNDSLFP